MTASHITQQQIDDLTLVKELITDFFHIEDFTMNRKIENVLPRYFFYHFAKKHTPYPWSVISKFMNQDHATAIHAYRAYEDLLCYDKYVQAKHEELKIIFENKFIDTAKVNQVASLINKYTIKLEKLKKQYHELTDTKFQNQEDIKEIQCEAVQLDASGLQIPIR